MNDQGMFRAITQLQITMINRMFDNNPCQLGLSNASINQLQIMIYRMFDTIRVGYTVVILESSIIGNASKDGNVNICIFGFFPKMEMFPAKES